MIGLRSLAVFLQALVAAAFCFWLFAPAIASAGEDTTAALRSRIEAGAPIVVHGVPLDRAMLATVYQARDFAPLWQGNPGWGPELTAALASANIDGLSPDRLYPPGIREALADPFLDPVGRELLLTDRFLVYASILARGQIAPAGIWADWALPSPRFDPVDAASRAAALGPAAALQSLRPASSDYAELQKALAFYTGIESAGGWPVLVLPVSLKPGSQGQGVVQLRLRLAAEGYLAPDRTTDVRFDGELTRAVMQFQQRHGLAADGAVGPQTLGALNVHAGQRADQIRINLERWREMSRLWPATRLEVSVPAQTLTYYRDGKVALTSRVIVGDVRHHTPVLAAAVERVVLDPTWNIPASIIANEIQPRLRRDPGYLARTHTVILGRGEGDPYGRDVDWSRTGILAKGWRLSQLPGTWNALGSVVLDMPNPYDVYLHDTPGRNLFARPQRALSHGCIRVEEVRTLAALLLGVPALPPAGMETRAIPLAAPVAVYLLYQTVFIDPEGAVEFRDDIYGRDKALVAMLALPEDGRPPERTVAGLACPGMLGGLS